MNIEDKPALFRELARVVRPGGRLAMHEILAGVNQPIRFPVPWARQPHTSFLLPPSQFRTLVADAGFTEIVWNDVSSAALHSGRERVQAMREHGLPPLGIHVVIGEDFPTMVSQVVTNLEEQRLVVIMGVWERRDSG